MANRPAESCEIGNASVDAAALLKEVEALRHRLAALEARLPESASAEPPQRRQAIRQPRPRSKTDAAAREADGTPRIARRRALGLGALASLFAFIGRSAARAADALTIEPNGNVRLGGALQIVGKNVLEFGVGTAKEGDAGKIGYQAFSDALDIFGAGTKAANRKIRMVADGGAAIEGPTTIGSSLRIVNLNALEFGYNIDGFGHIRNDGVSLEIFGVGTKARKIRMVADGGVTLIGPMNIDGTNTLEFGAGVSGKQVNAGKIGYQALTDYALDIVGAGTDLTNRKIKFWAEGGALFNGTAWVEGALRFKWGSDWRAITLRSGDFAGAETFGGGLPPSDIRFKTGLRPISDALEKVLQLNGRYYRWNQAGLRHFTRDIADALSAGPDATEADNQKLWDAERQKAHQALSGDRIGLIAQELETVVPELIHEDKEGYKYVRYEQLTALLVEAIKQQHALIQSLSDRLAAAEAR